MCLMKSSSILFGLPKDQSGSEGKESACNLGDLDSIPGLGRSPGEGMVMHPRILAWRSLASYSPWVAKSQIQLRD